MDRIFFLLQSPRNPLISPNSGKQKEMEGNRRKGKGKGKEAKGSGGKRREAVGSGGKETKLTVVYCTIQPAGERSLPLYRPARDDGDGGGPAWELRTKIGRKRRRQIRFGGIAQRARARIVTQAAVFVGRKASGTPAHRGRQTWLRRLQQGYGLASGAGITSRGAARSIQKVCRSGANSNMRAGNSPRSRSTAPITARRRRQASSNGATRRRTISSLQSRVRASPPTAACWPRPRRRSSGSLKAA